MKLYTPLHVHTHYSLLDGLSKPKDIVNRCKTIGATSCAITDHGSISGAVQFYQQLKSNNIKPILGCELYISKKCSKEKKKENAKLEHLVVLCKNLQGWKTLIKIVSESNHPDRFYHKPRVDLDTWEYLGETYSKDKNKVYDMSFIEKEAIPDEWNKQRIIDKYAK